MTGTKAGAVGAFLLAAVLLMKVLIPGALRVEFKSTPLGTTVRVVSTGSIQLRPGKHELEFSHPGYITQRQIISVQTKGLNTFPITLREAPLVARLHAARPHTIAKAGVAF